MAEAQGENLYTLTQVAKETKISMPTLQRYKKLYQDRIPSEGSGRSQRYPKEALAIFRELKKENIGRRGRPRKNASADGSAPKPARKSKSTAKRGRKSAAAAQTSSGDGLLTLTQIAKLAKISYPTLQRYVAKHGNEIPHEGTGRKRRYPPEAVEVFKQLRSESRRGRVAGSGKAKAAKPAKKAAGKSARRGRPPAAAAAPAATDSALVDRIKELEKSHKALEKTIARLEKMVAKPFKVTLQR